MPANKSRTDPVRKSLAEWCRRALGGELPPRAAGPCDCSQPAAPEAPALEYVSYHHEDRTHLELGKGTPGGRTRYETSGRVLSHDRLGGLHHRYDQRPYRPSLIYVCAPSMWEAQ